MRGSRAAVVLALVGWIGSIPIGLIGVFWGGGLRCDESCGGEGWSQSKDAWEWDVVVALGVAAFLCGALLVAAVGFGRRGAAAFALVGGLASTVVLATMLSPQWLQHAGRNGGTTFLAVVVVGAAITAVSLTPKARG
jgi:hypothetical protein